MQNQRQICFGSLPLLPNEFEDLILRKCRKETQAAAAAATNFMQELSSARTEISHFRPPKKFLLIESKHFSLIF